MTATTELHYVRPWLYAKQRDAIFCTARYGVTEASTKSGKTHGCLVWLLEQSLQAHRGEHCWWLAPSLKQAKIAFRRMKFGLRKTPEVFTVNNSELTITLLNGVTISFLTGEKPDLLYGEDVVAAVIDEATRVREDAWHAVRSTLTHTRGPIRIIGNVKGRKNWAYVMARKAESGTQDMHYAKLIAADAVAAGILDAEEVEDARQQLPESVFNELYNAVPSEDQGNPFGMAAIAKCVERYAAGGTPKIWAWDLARSVDFSVGVALDGQGNVCRFERFQESWPRTRERILAASGQVLTILETNAPGAPVLEEITRTGHDNYRGFVTTAVSKQQIMEGLAAGIQQHTLGIPDGVLRKELECFEYVVKRTVDGRIHTYYAAPEGLHDDCVVALAIAWHHLVREAPVAKPISLMRPSPWRRA